MVQPPPSLLRGTLTEHRLAVHKLVVAVHDFVWRALEHLRVPATDREDLAQDVLVDVLRDWQSYRAELGTPGQWLWGITRNHVRAFWRKQGKRPVLLGGLQDEPGEAPTPETPEGIVATERLLACLPPLQQRVVFLYEFAGCNYREIAALVPVSKSEAERQHKAGKRAIAAAVERSEGRRAGVLPLSMAALFGDDPQAGPPPEAVARAWERIVAEGLADPETPPSSGPRRRPRWGHLGTGGTLVVAGVLVASTIAQDEGLRTGSVVAVAAIATAGAAKDAERLPRDAEAVASVHIERKPPPPSAARLALPHHPSGLAHVRDLLSSAGAVQ